MRRHDKQINDEAIIDEILKLSEICRIGLVEEGIAYIVPLNYGYVNGVIYMHSSPEGRKMNLLKENNRVSFEIEYSGEVIKKDNACNWTTKYRSIMGIGTITTVTDPEIKRAGMDTIMKKYGFKGDLSYNPASFSRMVILELKIESIQCKQSGDW